MLTGMVQCGCCGGSLHTGVRDHGKQRAFFYAYTSYHLWGRSVCGNNLEVSMGIADRADLSTVEHDLLRPEVIEHAIAKAAERLPPDSNQLEVQRETLKGKLAKVEEELERLTTATASGGDLPTVLQGVKDRERRGAELREQLAALNGCERVSRFDLHQEGRELRGRLEDWPGLLCRQVGQARQILRKLLVGEISLCPEEGCKWPLVRAYRAGQSRPIAEGPGLSKRWRSPGGFESWRQRLLPSRFEACTSFGRGILRIFDRWNFEGLYRFAQGSLGKSPVELLHR